jgi:lipopolysaccharide transport system permease protein
VTAAAPAARRRVGSFLDMHLPRSAELALHLARREIASTQRLTLLGAAWPIIRQLAQLGVLVLVFSHFLDVGIEEFAVFVFCGLVVWNWFSSAVPAASRSVITRRHLALQPGFPAPVIPVTAVVVPLLEVLMVLPLLLLLVAVEGELRWSILLLPAVLALELVLLLGVAWLVAGVSVYLRDISNALAILMTLLFYVSAVFYDRSVVPDEYDWVLEVNPIAILIEAARAAVLDRPGPSALQLAWVSAAAVAVCAAGLLVFRRLQRGFADEL